MRRLVALLVAAALLGGCGAQPLGTGQASRLPALRRQATKPAPTRVFSNVPRHVYYQNVVVLLMYHALGPKPAGDTIAPAAFAGEMTSLGEAGFHFVSLAQVASFLRGGSLPDNAVAVTFDDGLESVYTYAYPILERDRIPFAGFLIAGRVSRYTGTLSWRQVQAMVHSGLFTVGSHTLSSHHAVPTGPGRTGPALVSRIYNPSTGTVETAAQYRARITADLAKARAVLRMETGQPVHWFAYPFGAYDPTVEQILAQCGYRYAVLAEWGWGVSRKASHLRLPRINAGTPRTTPQNIASTVVWIGGQTSRDPGALPPAALTPSWR